MGLLLPSHLLFQWWLFLPCTNYMELLKKPFYLHTWYAAAKRLMSRCCICNRKAWDCIPLKTWIRWVGGNNWSASRTYTLNLDKINQPRFLNLLSTLLIPVQKTISDFSENLMLTHPRAVVIKWVWVCVYVHANSMVAADNQDLVIVLCKGGDLEI